MRDPNRGRFTAADLVAVAVAAGLTVAGIAYVNSDDPTVIYKTTTVTVTPKVCERALTLADDVVDEAGGTIAAANEISALLQDVYDAGEAGAPIADKVRAWARGLRAEHSDLVDVPEQYDLLVQRCLAEVP